MLSAVISHCSLDVPFSQVEVKIINIFFFHMLLAISAPHVDVFWFIFIGFLASF